MDLFVSSFCFIFAALLKFSAMSRLINVYRICSFDGDVFIVRCEFIGDLLDKEQIHVKSCVRCRCLITNLQCKVS